MKLRTLKVQSADRANLLRDRLHSGFRLGLITSIDGEQIVTLVLNPADSSAELWETAVSGGAYSSLTWTIPQCHWFERTMWDMFGLFPDGHPRLKHNLLHEPYATDFMPLRTAGEVEHPHGNRVYHPMEVGGEGLYEVPVGPIHAGVIEPGHFRISCLGEIILNLELRLGYVHRGIEKRMTDVPWLHARFVAEAAASDMAAAEALAHAIAIEDICDVEPSPRAQGLRTMALEIERAAMHIADLGGIAGDIGFLAVSASMSRWRGSALALAEMLSGSRFLRGFVRPGGVSDCDPDLAKIVETVRELRKVVLPGLRFLMEDPGSLDRMTGVGKLAPHLAVDFGIVGVAGRAAGQRYDSRSHFYQGLYPEMQIPIPAYEDGDVLARANVRLDELKTSLQVIEDVAGNLPDGPLCASMPAELPPHRLGIGIVESHRGELLHFAVTDGNGRIMRYAIKDASVNNWTAVAIANRNGLLADFPLVNKSFALSYSGHDL